jgi:hypothetical protein
VLTSATGDTGLGAGLALGISILSFIVSTFALRYAKVQAVATKAMLDVEQGRDAEARDAWRASSSSHIEVCAVPAGVPGVAVLRVTNRGPGPAKAMSIDLERVHDGRRISRVALEKLATCASLEAGTSGEVNYPLASDASRSFTLRLAWTDTKRKVVETRIELG